MMLLVTANIVDANVTTAMRAALTMLITADTILTEDDLFLLNRRNGKKYKFPAITVDAINWPELLKIYLQT